MVSRLAFVFLVEADANTTDGFGDGKRIILVPRFLGTNIALIPLALWLKALCYRPSPARHFVNLQDSPDDRSLSEAIRDITRRVKPFSSRTPPA